MSGVLQRAIMTSEMSLLYFLFFDSVIPVMSEKTVTLRSPFEYATAHLCLPPH